MKKLKGRKSVCNVCKYKRNATNRKRTVENVVKVDLIKKQTVLAITYMHCS